MPRRVTYAIGDIHGRLDLVAAALEAIGEHHGPDGRRIVFLGDYVDRGPDSRAVVELMMSFEADPGVVCLKGNHEALMLKALDRPHSSEMQHWLRLGGRQTLESYGVDEADEDVRDKVPAAHLSWMTRLPLTSGDPHRIYVHAGLHPDAVFERQQEEHCLWIRERFLDAPAGSFDRHIVHGHTPLWRDKPEPAEPEILAHRTNLDTGAYMTGLLTVGVFPEDRPGGPEALIRIRSDAGGVEAELVPAGPAVAEAQSAPARKGWRKLIGL